MALQALAQILSAFASFGMLCVWAIYAWIFYHEFRRHRGALLFSHEAGSGDQNSECLLVNLSSEPVHVLCSLASAEEPSPRLCHLSGPEDVSVMERTKQRPLAPGGSMALGKFSDMRRRLSLSEDAKQDAEMTLEVRVAAIHGFRHWPVGARRKFNLTEQRVTPESFTTDQLQSRHDKREVQGWLEYYRNTQNDQRPPLITR